MVFFRVTVIVLLALLSAGGNFAFAGRLYGNASFSLEHTKLTDIRGTSEDNLTRESAIINYDDVLFTKNQLRFTANLRRQEYSFTNYHQFQPIYSVDLRSYGYSFNARYSPYTRRSRLAGTNQYLDVRYRDVRVTGQLNYDKWPTLNVIYTRLKASDDDVRRTDTYSRTWVADASYTLDPLSLRANVSELKQVDNIARSRSTITRTYSGTAALNKSISSVGYLSTTYNYYQTDRSAEEIASQESFTHSVTSLATINAIPNVGITASYSGRFLNSERSGLESKQASQNMSGLVSYAPASFLSFKGSKGYQINSQNGRNDITEYLSFGAAVTRFIRRGVDTRLSYDRTIFQQSQRVRTVQDTTGAIIARIDAGEYSVDTYHGAFNFSPRSYFRTFFNMTLTRDSDPIDPDRKYQFTRSVDARVIPTRTIEGRFTYTAIYLGEELKLTEAFSNNYNVGITYTPRSNLNLNVTYIYSTYNTALSSKRRTFTGFISYTYRRAFNAYVSVNRQKQEQQVFLPGIDAAELVELHPRSINGQLLIYMSQNVTLALSYFSSRSESYSGQDFENETIQGVITLQF
jgi:hypothetical protein